MEEIIYLDYIGLQHFYNSIKNYIDEKDTVIDQDIKELDRTLHLSKIPDPNFSYNISFRVNNTTNRINDVTNKMNENWPGISWTVTRASSGTRYIYTIVGEGPYDYNITVSDITTGIWTATVDQTSVQKNDLTQYSWELGDLAFVDVINDLEQRIRSLELAQN